MTAARSAPLRHIEALTRDVRLPLPPIRREHIEVVLETVAAAFKEVAAEQGKALLASDEKGINLFMEAKLCERLLGTEADDGYGEEASLVCWRQVAKAVARGRESVSHDGKRIELRPDLNIYLHQGHPSFPLTMECKVVDPKGGKTAKMYCDNGLVRYLCGEYGWAHSEAIMLAYVHNGSNPGPTLEPLLSPPGGENPYMVLQGIEATDATVPYLARSIHDRRFLYLNRKHPENKPGPISIWHL